MQRFIRERKTSYLRNVIISVLIFLLIFAGFGCGLTAMNKKMDQEEMQTLQNAITRSVTTCYTLEGSYPQSLGSRKTISRSVPISCPTLPLSGRRRITVEIPKTEKSCH